MRERPEMPYEEMRAGLLAGRRLCQEEWCTDNEKRWANEMVAEGIATATPWEYKDNFQCERRYVIGKGQANARR